MVLRKASPEISGYGLDKPLTPGIAWASASFVRAGKFKVFLPTS